MNQSAVVDPVPFLWWRGIVLGDECLTCHGSGRRRYGSTSTWMGGMGGASMTVDVCDTCWGSGDRYRHGVNLRILRNEESVRVAAAAVDALAQAAGANLRTAAPQVLEIVKLLREAVNSADNPRRGKARNGMRDSIWFAPLAKSLADLLEKAVSAR